MSKDIVTRLRERGEDGTLGDAASQDLMVEAAAEIERLREDVVEAEKYNGWHQQAMLENERLREDVKTLSDALTEMQNDRDAIEEKLDAEVKSLRAQLEQARSLAREIASRQNTEHLTFGIGRHGRTAR